MPIMDPQLKRLAQEVKSRHFNLCRNCKKKFRTRIKCPRCGSRHYRVVDHSSMPRGK